METEVTETAGRVPRSKAVQEASGQETPGREAVIEVRDLTNRFGEQLVHDRLNLDVYRGEILAVIGGSGAGKSVLLRSIVGLQAPASGNVRVLGEDLLKLAPEQRPRMERRFGVLFSGARFFRP